MSITDNTLDDLLKIVDNIDKTKIKSSVVFQEVHINIINYMKDSFNNPYGITMRFLIEEVLKATKSQYHHVHYLIDNNYMKLEIDGDKIFIWLTEESYGITFPKKKIDMLKVKQILNKL